MLSQNVNYLNLKLLYTSMHKTMNKKAEAHHHIINFVLSFLVGAIFMYLVAKGIIPLNIAVCPVP
jgi:heme/copper-type cytochrome/quinol oxidase subunit 4